MNWLVFFKMWIPLYIAMNPHFFSPGFLFIRFCIQSFWISYDLVIFHKNVDSSLFWNVSRFWSSLRSAQSDQSLRCLPEESLDPKLPIEGTADWSDWADAQADLSLHWTHCYFVGFVRRTAKTLIRLGGCPGWSVSSLGAHAILLVLSWGGSNVSLNTAKLLPFHKMAHFGLSFRFPCIYVFSKF